MTPPPDARDRPGAATRLRALRRDWRIKAAVQSGLSLLPRAPRLVDAARRRRTPYLEDRYVRGKWAHVIRHARAADRSGAPLRGRHVLDLGTGWFPIVPVGLRLAGAARVTTIDVVEHLDAARLRLTLERVLALTDDGTLSLPRGVDSLDETVLDTMRRLVARPGTLDPVPTLAELGVAVHIGDARDLDAVEESASASMFVSNNTLEHIDADVIHGVLTEFRRLTSTTPHAVMHHHIDLADHYAHADPRIGPFHYLRYSQRRWRLIDNALLHQNRLRASEYERLHEESGWRIVERREERRDVEDLRRVPVHADFAGFDEDDLAVVRTALTSVPGENIGPLRP